MTTSQAGGIAPAIELTEQEICRDALIEKYAKGKEASADEVRSATGFAVGGVPPLGHDRSLRTIVDDSLRRFGRVWCAAGTPHAVFEIETEALFRAAGAAE